MKVLTHISIRKLPPEKWEQYRNFRLASLQEEPLAFGKSYEEEVSQPQEYWLQRIDSMYFATHEDKAVGMAGFRTLPTQKHTHIAEIFSVYVARAYQQQGIATTLMDTILCEIQNIPDVKKILTNVTVTQKSAQQLYKKLGFVEVGRLKDDLFFDGGYYDGLIMEKYL